VKICVYCQERFASSGWNCPRCGGEPIRIDDQLAFAPDLARASEGFEQRYFADLAAVEAGNFWFQARNQLIVWALGRFFPQTRSLLEVGCGTGFVLSALENAFPTVQLHGSEIFCEGLRFAATRTRQAQLFQMDAKHIPFEREFDVIGAFDVIEHIEDDQAALGSMFRALKPGGGLLLTVPQHAWLWSKVDEYSHHFRRYDRATLQGRLEAAGFRLKTITSFVSVLLPPMLASRLLQRFSRAPVNPEREMKLGRGTNSLFGWLLDGERALIRLGLRLPAGGSLLAVAERPA
jgi:SAM-dependent methyltransferase